MRWTLICCAVAICLILAGGSGAGGLAFAIGLVGASAYALLKIVFAVGDYFNARSEFKRQCREIEEVHNIHREARDEVPLR